VVIVALFRSFKILHVGGARLHRVQFISHVIIAPVTDERYPISDI